MPTTTATSKGQIVIPSEIRKRLSIKQGTRFNIEERGDEIILRPLTSENIKKMAGILGSKGQLAKKLLKERAKDKRTED
jgi:AbrB family looped-hinge helix DNA binding protein